VSGYYADDDCGRCNKKSYKFADAFNKRRHFACKHNCVRCGQTGYVHGLEEI
jgi:hypothetical protein